MARKKIALKSKDTRRRYTDEFKEEAVQMLLDGRAHRLAHHASAVTTDAGNRSWLECVSPTHVRHTDATSS